MVSKALVSLAGDPARIAGLQHTRGHFCAERVSLTEPELAAAVPRAAVACERPRSPKPRPPGAGASPEATPPGAMQGPSRKRSPAGSRRRYPTPLRYPPPLAP